MVKVADTETGSSFLMSLTPEQADLAGAIQDMTDDPKQVTYETFRRHCDGVDEWALEHGYGLRKPDLTLKRDGCVSFWKSLFRGKPCYYIDWSCHQFVWA